MRRLQADPELPSEVSFVDGGTLGLELVSYVQDPPGTLLKFGVAPQTDGLVLITRSAAFPERFALV